MVLFNYPLSVGYRGNIYDIVIFSEELLGEPRINYLAICAVLNNYRQLEVRSLRKRASTIDFRGHEAERRDKSA